MKVAEHVLEAPHRESSRQVQVSYLLFALCCGLYLVPFMPVLLLEPDQGTLLTGAVRVARGQVFARDFVEVMGPGTFYWLALFMKLFGVTFLATRLCLFFTSFGTGLLIYFLSRRICTRFASLACLLIGAAWPAWPAISHHIDSNFFALAGISGCVFWLDKHKSRFLFTSGVLAGITTCFHQPKGMLLFAALLIWIYLVHRRSLASRASSIACVIVGYIGILCFVLLYFWSHAALWDLINSSFIWPSKHYGMVNRVPYAQGLILYYWEMWRAMGGVLSIVLAGVLIVPLLLISALPVVIPVLGIRQRVAFVKPEIVLYWLCGSALWLSEIHRRDIFHLVFGSPLLVILFIFYVQEMKTKTAEAVLQLASICACCLAVFNLFLTLSAHTVATRVGKVAMFNSDHALAILEQKVRPGEEILVYPYCPTYYFLSEAVNPTRYSLLMYGYNTPSEFEEVVRVLDQRHVKYVLWGRGFYSTAVATFFPLADQGGSGSHIVEPYLESHYSAVWANKDYLLLERKTDFDLVVTR